MTRFRAFVGASAIIAAGFAACAEPVSQPDLGDYTQWPAQGGAVYTVRGPAPGHGDTVRLIFVNAIAHQAPPGPLYPLDAVIVKEIREDDDGVPGDLLYIGIMRQVTQPETILADEGGWLFSERKPADAPEVHFDYCWARCHVAAPYNGAFYDYRRD